MKFHAQKQIGKSHVIDIFTSYDTENISLCTFQHLTLYYIIKLYKCLQNAGNAVSVYQNLKKISGSIPPDLPSLESVPPTFWDRLTPLESDLWGVGVGRGCYCLLVSMTPLVVFSNLEKTLVFNAKFRFPAF